MLRRWPRSPTFHRDFAALDDEPGDPRAHGAAPFGDPAPAGQPGPLLADPFARLPEKNKGTRNVSHAFLQSRPQLRICTMKFAMDPMLNHMHETLKRVGDHWRMQQTHKGIKSSLDKAAYIAREWPLLIAASGEMEKTALAMIVKKYETATCMNCFALSSRPRASQTHCSRCCRDKVAGTRSCLTSIQTHFLSCVSSQC
jgi:hypothetical protein